MQTMPIHVTLIPGHPPGTPPPTYIHLQIDESADHHLAISLKPDSPTNPNAYNVWYSPSADPPTQIKEIEVRYYDSSTEDFRLRGTTTDGAKPEICAIEHVDAAHSSTQVAWKYSGTSNETIDWTFTPPELGQWVSWRFNPEGNTPPVRVKVVLRRQS